MSQSRNPIFGDDNADVRYQQAGRHIPAPLRTALQSHGLKLLGILAVLAIPATVFAHQSASNNSGTSNFSPASSSQSELEDLSPEGVSSIQQSYTVESSEENSSSSTKVLINGQNVPVPTNGTMQTTINDESNQSSVDITVDNQSSSQGNSSNSSTTIIEVENHSSSSGNEESSESRTDRRR